MHFSVTVVGHPASSWALGGNGGAAEPSYDTARRRYRRARLRTVLLGCWVGLLMALPRLDNWQTRAAQGFEQTGLGDRMATLFVRAFGKSTLGLAYGLSVAEALVAPAMPSTTARAGGIFMPIINSLALANGSKPGARARLKPHGIGLVSDSRVQRR